MNTTMSDDPGLLWDARAASWDDVASSPAFQKLAARVVALAAPRPDDCAVDLGAGTGLLALTLAPAVSTVVAVDASAAMLERLHARAGEAGIENVRTVRADLRSLPLPDECASVVVSNYAFHHLDDAGKELALSEARRILVPGGRLVVCDMMFALSLRARDRRVIASKVALLARRGPRGLGRLARNAARLAAGRWEHPAPAARWQRMLADRRFEDVAVSVLEHEGGIAVARRPLREAP